MLSFSSILNETVKGSIEPDDAVDQQKLGFLNNFNINFTVIVV